MLFQPELTPSTQELPAEGRLQEDPPPGGDRGSVSRIFLGRVPPPSPLPHHPGQHPPLVSLSITEDKELRDDDIASTSAEVKQN